MNRNKFLVVLFIAICAILFIETGIYIYIQMSSNKSLVKTSLPSPNIKISPSVNKIFPTISPTPVSVHKASFAYNTFEGVISDMDTNRKVIEWDYDYRLRLRLSSETDSKNIFISKYLSPYIKVFDGTNNNTVPITIEDLRKGDTVSLSMKVNFLDKNNLTNLLYAEIVRESRSNNISPPAILPVPTSYLQRQTFDVKTASPSSIMNAGGNTYHNSTIPFTFKYPKNIDVIDGPEIILKYQATPLPWAVSINDGWIVRFTPVSLSKSGLESLKDLTDRDINITIDSEAKITKELSPITFNSMAGFTYHSKGAGDTDHFYFQSPYNKDVYVVIATLVVDPTKKGYQNIVDQILSSFSFTQ